MSYEIILSLIGLMIAVFYGGLRLGVVLTKRLIIRDIRLHGYREFHKWLLENSGSSTRNNPMENLQEKIDTLWPQAAAELRGFAEHLDRKNAGLTAAQLRMAVDMADGYAAERQTRIKLQEMKDCAYRERDQLVAALSKIFPSHLCMHGEDPSWDADWLNIVCIHIPLTDKCILQATWHIHQSELPMFQHLKMQDNHWDGMTTEEKYKRLLELKETSKEGA